MTGTAKPEIILKEGTLFSTSEVFYARRQLLSDLLEITSERSSLGRIVTARVVRGGKVMLSGPSSAQSLSRWVQSVEKFTPDLTIVDGALSRLSSASPIISESLILTTGAAYSADLETLVRRTKFIVELVRLDVAEENYRSAFDGREKGVWGMDKEGNVIDFQVESSLAIDKIKDDLTGRCEAVFVAGALTDRFLGLISDSKRVGEIELVVSDFTKIFVSEQNWRIFLRKGGKLKVLRRSKLIAVCVNPVSPRGIVLDSDLLCRKMYEAVGVPVYDIVKNGENI